MTRLGCETSTQLTRKNRSGPATVANRDRPSRPGQWLRHSAASGLPILRALHRPVAIATLDRAPAKPDQPSRSKTAVGRYDGLTMRGESAPIFPMSDHTPEPPILAEVQSYGVVVFCWCNRCYRHAVLLVSVLIAQLGQGLSFTCVHGRNALPGVWLAGHSRPAELERLGRRRQPWDVPRY